MIVSRSLRLSSILLTVKESGETCEDSQTVTGVISSVVTILDFAMRYVSRYLGHDAIRIAILVYRVSRCLDLQFAYDGNAI